MTADEILKKYEDDNEYHLHEVDRKWVIAAMEEYAALRQPLVSCWRYFSSSKPKWNTKIELIWSDKTEDSIMWSKPNVEQIDFDIDCRPLKWRYACR